MPPMTALFKRLSTFDDPSIDGALAEAARAASDEDLAPLARLILDRTPSEATLELVRVFHRLDATLQAAVAEAAVQEAQPLREACRQVSAPAARNAVAIIARTRLDIYAYLLESLLHHGEGCTKQAAGRCLVRLAVASNRRNGSETENTATESTDGVIGVTERLLRRYDPSEESFVIAAALAVANRASPHRFAMLDDAGHPAVRPVGRRVMRPASKILRRALPSLARHAPLRNPVRQGVGWARDQGKLGDVIARSHLLMVQPAGEALRGCCPGDPVGMNPGRLPATAARGLPRWLAALDSDPSDQTRALAALRDHPDPMARLAAVRHLVTLAGNSRDDPAWETVLSFCRDPNEAIARVAFAALCRGRCTQLPRWLPGLLRDAPEVVRSRAASLMAREGFDRLWTAWPVLSAERQQSAGRAMLKIDTSFHLALQRYLASSQRRDVLRGLSMIDVLYQTCFFTDCLVVLADSPDHHIASRAVTVLATSQEPNALQALDRALDHTNSRVRANAVESLVAGRIAHHAKKLSVMAWKEENRPQANAVRALLHHDPDGGRDALLSMLRDIRPPHRSSALWVIGAEGMTEMSSRVAEISISDAAADVRRRASGVVENLICLMHRKPPNNPSISMMQCAPST